MDFCYLSFQFIARHWLLSGMAFFYSNLAELCKVWIKKRPFPITRSLFTDWRPLSAPGANLEVCYTVSIFESARSQIWGKINLLVWSYWKVRFLEAHRTLGSITSRWYGKWARRRWERGKSSLTALPIKSFGGVDYLRTYVSEKWNISVASTFKRDKIVVLHTCSSETSLPSY